jgi:protein transport protein SEC24
VNPFIKFIDNGARWICNFCKLDNTTEGYYYSQLDQTGQRVDINERAELYSGSVDFLASSEYMNRPPMPPTFVFLLDVSQQAVESGYLQQACSTIKGIIEEGTLPGGERTRVAFLAFDKTLYYFNLRSTLKQPQMMVVPELSENYLPQPDDLLVNLHDSHEIICTMLDSFQNYFAQPSGSVVDCALVPAITSAFNICKHIGGRMLLF